MGERQGSICSISNASTSSYASSDVSSSSYGGIKLDNLDKTLTATVPSNKSYRRCYSDNNGHEQHYYPSSITSSIAEHGGDSDAEDSGNNDTLLPANHKRKPRRASLSRSEDLQGGSINRHHPLSLAVRNEYYSTIRFSSISSGDSGFVSHPDQVNGNDGYMFQILFFEQKMPFSTTKQFTIITFTHRVFVIQVVSQKPQREVRQIIY